MYNICFGKAEKDEGAGEQRREKENEERSRCLVAVRRKNAGCNVGSRVNFACIWSSNMNPYRQSDSTCLIA
jgi:hypothetical protein